MYEKLNSFIETENAEKEEIIKLADFILNLPKGYSSKIGDAKELFDSVTKEDLIAIRKNLCSCGVFYEGELEMSLGYRFDGISLYNLMDDSTHYRLQKYKSKNKVFF